MGRVASVVAEGLTVGRPGVPPLVEGLHLQVSPGEMVAVLGPSGSGKTTLLDTIEGRLAPRAGAVRRFDTEGRNLPAREWGPRVARVEQDLLLVDALSLEQNVLLGRLNRYPWWRTFFAFPRRDREEARALLAELGLGHLWWRPAAGVSGGERQRTALARALFAGPSLLLADEPTASLDGETAERALQVIRAHARDAAVIVVLHDRDLAFRHADRVIEL